MAVVLDTSATLNTDIGKGGRVYGKETMARRRYQEGCLFMRGTAGRKVWVARWRNDALRPDGTVIRVMRSQVLGPVSRISTRREARVLLNALLRPTNQGLRKPHSTMQFGNFAKVGGSSLAHLSRVHTKLLPGYSSQTFSAQIRAILLVRYLYTRPTNIPQPKGRTLRTLRVAPYTRYDEPRLWQRKGMGLFGEQSCGRRSASASVSRSAQGNLSAWRPSDGAGQSGGTTPHARLPDRGHGHESVGVIGPSVA